MTCSARDIHTPWNGDWRSGDEVVGNPVMQEAAVYGNASTDASQARGQGVRPRPSGITGSG
jgi:hypothetical protein